MAREQIFYRARAEGERPVLQPGRPRWTLTGELLEPLLWWELVTWHNHPGQGPEPAWVAESAARDEGEGWPMEYWIVGQGRRLQLAHGFQPEGEPWRRGKSLDEAVTVAELVERQARRDRGMEV